MHVTLSRPCDWAEFTSFADVAYANWPREKLSNVSAVELQSLKVEVARRHSVVLTKLLPAQWLEEDSYELFATIERRTSGCLLNVSAVKLCTSTF
jgi:hypothetical protein